MVHGGLAVKLLLRQRATWTFELCCLESPVNKWWSLWTRNRKVRVALRLFPEFPWNKNRGRSSLQDKGCHPKGWDWGVPFLVFKVFSFGVRVIFFFFQKRYLLANNMGCLWMLPSEFLWISGFHEFNSSSPVRQATICPLPVVTFKFFHPISKSCTF